MVKKTPEQIVIDAFEGSRQNRTFKNWSDDTFIGYVTASANLQNLGVNKSVEDWEVLVRHLVRKGKI